MIYKNRALARTLHPLKKSYRYVIEASQDPILNQHPETRTKILAILEAQLPSNFENDIANVVKAYWKQLNV